MRIFTTLLALMCFSVLSKSLFVSLNIKVANENVHKSGWEPLPLQCESEDEKEKLWFANDAKQIYQAGIISVHHCSGTGSNYCTFYYKKAEQCLKLVTSGEFGWKGLEGLIVEREFFDCPEEC